MRSGAMLFFCLSWLAAADGPTVIFEHTLGGSGDHSASAIALDKDGNIYVAGQTDASDLPTLNAAQSHPGTSVLINSSDAGGHSASR